MRHWVPLVVLGFLAIVGASVAARRFIVTDDAGRLGGGSGATPGSAEARFREMKTDYDAASRPAEAAEAKPSQTMAAADPRWPVAVEQGLAVHVMDPSGAALFGIDVVVDGLISRGDGFLSKPIARHRTTSDGIAVIPLEDGLERRFHKLRVGVDVAAIRTPEVTLDLPLTSDRRIDFELAGYAWLDVTVARAIGDDDSRAAMVVIEMSDRSTAMDRVATFEVEIGKSTSIPVETGIELGTHLEYSEVAIEAEEMAESITLATSGEHRPLMFRLGDHLDFVTLRVLPPDELPVSRVAVSSSAIGDDELPQEVALECPVDSEGLVRIGIPKRLREHQGAWELIVRPVPWWVKGLDVDLELVGRITWTNADYEAKAPIEVRLEPWEPSIRRRIVDADGAPIPGAMASLVLGENDQLPWSERVARRVAWSGASGNVVLARSDDYGNPRTFVYAARGHRTQGEFIDETSPSDATIVLPRGRSLTVRPLLDEGCQLADFEARFVAEDGSSPVGGAAPRYEPNEDSWGWLDLPTGAGKVLIKTMRGVSDGERSRTLIEYPIEGDSTSADRTIDLDLRGSMPIVRVQVVDETEKPIPYASFRREVGGREGTLMSGLDGTFALIAERTRGRCAFGAEGFQTRILEGPIQNGTIMLRPGQTMTIRVDFSGEEASDSKVPGTVFFRKQMPGTMTMTDTMRVTGTMRMPSTTPMMGTAQQPGPGPIVVGIARVDQQQWIAKAVLRPDGTATFVMPGPGRYRAGWMPYTPWVDEQPASAFSSSQWSDEFEFR